VEIHPATAEKHGIKRGDWVVISSPRGSIRQRAVISGDIHPNGDPLRARLVVPGTRRSRARLLGVEREHAHRPVAALRSGDGDLPVARTAVPDRQGVK